VVEEVVAATKDLGVRHKLGKEQTSSFGGITCQADMERQMLRLDCGGEVAIRKQINGSIEVHRLKSIAGKFQI
jgi:hypothetical protein